MKNKKISAAIIGVILTLCMVMSLVPHMVFAEGGTTVTLTALEGTGGDGDEGYPKLVDGKKSSDNFSKWCMSLPTDGAYIVVSVPDAVKVTGYTLTTGNDNSKYPGRNPSGWVLYGCNDYTGAGSGS